MDTYIVSVQFILPSEHNYDKVQRFLAEIPWERWDSVFVLLGRAVDLQHQKDRMQTPGSHASVSHDPGHHLLGRLGRFVYSWGINNDKFPIEPNGLPALGGTCNRLSR